jgi:hypothetical protein
MNVDCIFPGSEGYWLNVGPTLIWSGQCQANIGPTYLDIGDGPHVPINFESDSQT